MVDLTKLTTETRNRDTINLDRMTSIEIATIMNKEDEKVIKSVRDALPKIAEVIDMCTETLEGGGRIIYMGAGTSGRLGLLDAVECPPTFGVSSDLVVGLIAGGQSAFIKATLGDSFEESLANLLYKNISGDNGNSKLLDSISKLCLKRKGGVGVKAIVTYNFDDLLEDNFDKYNIQYHSLYSELDYTTSDKLGIYHVHGFLPRHPSQYEKLYESLLVFSEDRYHSLYNDPYSWTNITQLNFLRENTTLMIGLSLTDPNLRRILSIANRKNKMKKHYAIMRRKNFKYDSNDININNDILKKVNIINNDLHEKSFEQLGINIIWVEDYNDISNIIEDIIAK